MLAVQNMAASGTVAKNQEIEFNALSGSLSMMSKGELTSAAVAYRVLKHYLFHQSSTMSLTCEYLNVVCLRFGPDKRRSNRMDMGKFESASRVSLPCPFHLSACHPNSISALSIPPGHAVFIYSTSFGYGCQRPSV